MPQIRPITDLRNTNEISELCHARREPVFITKHGYGDLVIMSMETYEALTAAPPPAAAPEPEEMCFLTEKAPVWAGVLAEVLAQNRIPFVKESARGAGMTLRAGSMLDTIRFFVPRSQLKSAQELAEGLFAGEETD